LKSPLNLLLPAGTLLRRYAEFNALPDQIGDGSSRGGGKLPESLQLLARQLNLSPYHLDIMIASEPQ